MAVNCGEAIHSMFLFISLADEQWHRAEEKLVYGVESNSTLLNCVPRSLQAKVLWFLQKGGGEKQEVTLYMSTTIHVIYIFCVSFVLHHFCFFPPCRLVAMSGLS